MDYTTILQISISGLAMGAIYALIAEGFYIAHRITNTLNFGQGDFLMLGCFIALLFIHLNFPYLLVFVLVVVFLALAGIVLERVAIRPVAHAGLSYVLTGMGFAMIVQNAVIVLWGNHARPFPSLFGGSRAEAVHLCGIGFFPEEIFIILASLAVMICFFLLLKKTLIGKAFSAVAYNADTAFLFGINVIRIKVAAYIIASILAGISGFLVGPVATVEPFMGFKLTIKGFAAAILGGFMNPVGVLVGSLLLGLIENFACLMTSEFGDMIAFLLIIAVLIFRPSGLFKEQEIY
ncbi:MAG: branched-chain amino acid ABC transporter permease [Deltaproteobacteria bacterium]|nr:branched-chain amino acid ABC transporter permease [Deltaproteobacteria bacterium]